MRPVRGMRFVAVAAIGGLALAAAGCNKAPSSTNPSSSTTTQKYVACMVTDQGGLDDKSFNASAWKGMEAAKTANPNIDIKNVASSKEADYEPNLTQFVNQKCNFILAVGGLMGTATEKIAKNNPTQQFAIVDAKINLPNVYPMQFNTAQAGFLAGYLAAGYSKTGKVGTYGGLNIPPVTVFMDGFSDGVAYYNTAKGKKVQVLGWDKAKQKGLFSNDFASPPKGKQLSDSLVAQGADVIMPVAGGTGLGTTGDAKTTGKFAGIWVDVDGCESTSNCSALLTTVVKNIPDAVKDAVIKGASGGNLSPDNGYLGTLANNGVSIAPYHEFDSKIDPALKAEVDKLKADIIAGTVKVESVSSPK